MKAYTTQNIMKRS